MNGHEVEPDLTRLAAARSEVQSYLVKKRRWTTALFWIAGLLEGSFFVAMLLFMDFADRLNWFLFFGFLLVYTPLVIMTWRNSVKIDELYYRLVEELMKRQHDE
jgi:uncharacterized membrane protein